MIFSLKAWLKTKNVFDFFVSALCFPPGEMGQLFCQWSYSKIMSNVLHVMCLFSGVTTRYSLHQGLFVYILLTWHTCNLPLWNLSLLTVKAKNSEELWSQVQLNKTSLLWSVIYFTTFEKHVLNLSVLKELPVHILKPLRISVNLWHQLVIQC